MVKLKTYKRIATVYDTQTKGVTEKPMIEGEKVSDFKKRLSEYEQFVCVRKESVVYAMTKQAFIRCAEVLQPEDIKTEESEDN